MQADDRVVNLTLPGFDAEATADGCVFDEDAAIHAVSFFSDYLHHVKGSHAGEPFDLEDWQIALVATTFGWKRPDGSRRFRTVYLEVPRKNGKSTLAAGIALYLLFMDGEPGAEIYSAAAEREQASLVFDVARQMVETDDVLRKHSQTYRRSIVLKNTVSSYKVLSADAHTKHGFNAHGVIIDELHAMPNRDLWDVLTTSTGARRQPLTVAITTAGFDRHSICYEVHDYATKVRDGIIKDNSFLPVIYAAAEDDDWTDPATWAKANPNLGKSISVEYLAAQIEKAKEVPAYENVAKRLFLNLWTEQATRWLPMDTWDEGGDPFDPATLEGRRCFAGLDMASTIDITAFVLVFPPSEEEEPWHVLPFCFVPGDNAHQRERRDKVPYATWGAEGHIELTDGNVIDQELIRARINELAERFDIKEIALDRWGSQGLATALEGDGHTVVMFGQGFRSMSSPSKELEALVLSRRMAHGGHPLLRWAASNVAAEQDAAGNIKPNKKKSTERIDPIVALIMAIGRASVHQQDDGDGSVYYDRGLITT